MMRLLGVVMLALAACGHAVSIHRDPSGGVLRLGGNRGIAMDDARRQMADHCRPGGFAITQEGEEEGRTATEYRVHYQCSTTAAAGESALSDVPTPQSSPPALGVERTGDGRAIVYGDSAPACFVDLDDRTVGGCEPSIAECAELRRLYMAKISNHITECHWWSAAACFNATFTLSGKSIRVCAVAVTTCDALQAEYARNGEWTLAPGRCFVLRFRGDLPSTP